MNGVAFFSVMLNIEFDDVTARWSQLLWEKANEQLYRAWPI